ncbi:aminoglycoside phosphotransferase [Aestuariivirga litoralis]|uniref:Aminoglycoside phosphotransferase n=1 Tax=Aestuariivirga litoralis TaxID=2650924 RepID=A0A2W2ANP9_9HYPH|nr:phosphotransferase [Aestuariivirga litoralis]PZF75202.1 aminoglycoside phosphotransferase [Aestuariivirga litoralis]
MTAFNLLAHDEQMRILHDLALRALALYPLPPGTTAKLLNLSENATYRIDAPDGRRWALRVHRDGYQSDMAIASELAWAVDLRRSGIAVTPNPIHGRDGALVQSVPDARMASPRRVVLFDWETGAEPGITDNLTHSFAALGEIAARMHVHARRWQRPQWFTRHTWNFDTALGEDRPHWGRWRDGIGMDGEKRRLFQRTVDLIGRRLAAYGMGRERFGLIHSDLRLANLLIDGSTVKVIDFDDCGFSWYMYDAATPVSFYEHEPQVPELIEHWKAGYRKVLPLSQEDEAEIPTFVMLRRILLVAWIASHIEAEFPKSLGAGYTDGTLPLCEDYMRRFG